MTSKLSLTLALFTSALTLSACDEANTRGDDDLAPAAQDGERGGNGKADAIGSCAPEDCGGQASSGSCWCDDQCAQYGDCCVDIAPVCEGEVGGADGEACNLLDGCSVGSYCAWSGEGQAGVCAPASELVAEAVETVRTQFPESGVTATSDAVVTRTLGLHQGDVMTGSSYYTVDLDGGKDRLAHVRFDVAGVYLETWRAVPEDLRNTAPWGNAEYVVPGTVQMTMDHAITLDELHDTFVGPVLDTLDIGGLHRSSQGDLWFFDLNVPGFTELETIAKVESADHVVEAWPNRIQFFSHGHEEPGVEEVIAEF